jgi:hypothetical protein
VIQQSAGQSLQVFQDGAMPLYINQKWDHHRAGAALMLRVYGLLAAMGLLATTSAAHAAGSEGITLAVTSPDEATPFTASCTVTGPEGERSETFDRTTPMHLVFEDAKGLRCRLESAGALEVTAKGPGGNVSRTRTSGGTVTLSLGL